MDTKETTACLVKDCTTEAKTGGYCGKRYQRFLKHGDPLAMALRGGAAVKAKTAANPPAPTRHTFEAVWPITGPHNCTAPTADEAQGLCTIAMFEIHRIALGLGVEMLGAPKFQIIPTASNPRAAAHPEATHCPYTLRATTRAARRQGVTA